VLKADFVAMINEQYDDEDNMLFTIWDRDKIAKVASDLDVSIGEDTIDEIIERCERLYSEVSYDDIASVVDEISSGM